MGLIFLIGSGALLGWLTTIVLQTGGNALKVNLASGIGGALVGGLLVNPLIGEGNLLAGGYSIAALLISLGGSVVLLASVNILRHRELR
ncbi:hypothetical protein GCM10009127_03520 [Alteraurantiacibacter aestuarii]|uniref:GlsB/YeaQ/YmgE family stress response membrane protein n=1 Tax=Alteraurantiacibacter aestuarii TaxID=650004 RepID=A0A844ZLF0_9SPHN|nr:GlsB/YeaQ/YmgE family stress response membrane protein [Alteraurantiacibacter aestuarii]MXO88394.1 GlsB/YeaQ/YmgE family stress response membrane protein [Alteraurantiacibacter aestuarii]